MHQENYLTIASLTILDRHPTSHRSSLISIESRLFVSLKLFIPQKTCTKAILKNWEQFFTHIFISLSYKKEKEIIYVDIV